MPENLDRETMNLDLDDLCFDERSFDPELGKPRPTPPLTVSQLFEIVETLPYLCVLSDGDVTIDVLWYDDTRLSLSSFCCNKSNFEAFQKAEAKGTTNAKIHDCGPRLT